MDTPDAHIGSAGQRIASTITDSTNEHDVESLRRVIVEKLTYAAGRDPLVASDRDWFVAAALALRDRIVERWLSSTRDDNTEKRKRVYYLSLEFLPGRLLLDSLNNAGLTETMRLALAALGVDLERLRTVGTGSGAGQWRPRAAGRLFHGKHGKPRHSYAWFRHSLQSWVVPAGDP